MADYALVEWTLDTLAANYTPANVETSTPVLVDDADGTTYQLDTDASDRSELQRRYDPDPLETNIVTVDSSPDRQEEPVGTKYVLDVTDAVNITIEGVHAGEGGEVRSPGEFRTLKNEVRRAVLVERTSYPTIGGNSYRSIIPQNAGRPPEDQQANYFAYSFDLAFSGYEDPDNP